MKTIKLLIALMCLNAFSYAQKKCHTDILNGEVLKPANLLSNYNKYDFANLWLQQKNDVVYGALGNEHQRILVKLITVIKNENNANEYLVTGKTSVMGNVCDFTGNITLQKVQETIRKQFGVDNELAGKSKTQGLLTATYEFKENPKQQHVGTFKGTLQTKWFVNTKGEIQYDNINSQSDSYFNNAFVGTWQQYGDKKVKTCNWGDFRVPAIDCDFDIGAGDFSVSQKYLKYGWSNPIKNNGNWWK